MSRKVLSSAMCGSLARADRLGDRPRPAGAPPKKKPPAAPAKPSRETHFAAPKQKPPAAQQSPAQSGAGRSCVERGQCGEACENAGPGPAAHERPTAGACKGGR